MRIEVPYDPHGPVGYWTGRGIPASLRALHGSHELFTGDFPHTVNELVLNDDRYFDSDPAVRRIARDLYDGIRDLPLICPHGHVDPAILAADAPFPEPASLLIVPDHYIVRMLYSAGIPPESIGISPTGGDGAETDPRRIWQIFADHFHLYRGTPTGAWLNHELYELFGVRSKLGPDTAQRIYDQVKERLETPEFRPRALFERFRIEVLATTDIATDPLKEHQAIRESGWGGRVVPCFRPDALFRPASAHWKREIAALSRSSGIEVVGFSDFVLALEDRRRFFRSMGATATDHGVTEPYTARLEPHEAERIFRKGIGGEATAADQRAFEAHMLVEMARMSTEDGLVMQLHPGSFRDHNQQVFARYGSDRGGDIPIATEFTRNLHALLNEYGNDPRLTLIVFTLDEATYTRELAPLAGHYPALKLGPAWWFQDSIEGMTRYRQLTTETAGIYNTVGFNDDTRAFCSIPARHDLARRVDVNWLAGLVARHVIDITDAREMAHDLAYGLAKKTYNFDTRERPPVALTTSVASPRGDNRGIGR
jgi:glucuronate isomerase